MKVLKQQTYIAGLDADKAKAAIEFLKTSGAPFSVTMTNYTINIKGAVNYKFMKEERSIKFFNMFRELKKQVSEYLNECEIAEIKANYYYDIHPREDFEADEVYNIDLTSAYLFVLKNERIITDELFEKLQNLDKQDRLSIVGMLASRKSVFYFNESGTIIAHEIIEDKRLRNVFFHCVNVTHLIMLQCKDLIGEDYIYSWVDGVYFLERSNYFLIEDLLMKLGYPFKFETLENFIYKREKGFINISFDKGIKRKNFAIPIEKNKFASDIYNFLQSQL